MTVCSLYVHAIFAPPQSDNYWLILQGSENQERDKKSAQGAQGGPHKHTQAFSEFESRYGRHADPLYSRHQRGNFIAGLDPTDPEIVYVDPHILATPTLADTNGDGSINELVVPVSYYFDPFYYGDPHQVAKLGGLETSELVHFVAGGIVIVDLTSGAIIEQKLLGLTEASDSQPSYVLSTPTIVRMFPGVGGARIIVAVGTGELHVLEASSLDEEAGFPVHLDSLSAQVAVADIFQDGTLELVVGDNSGNIYCIGSRGNRLWEFETHDSIQSDVRFADFDGDTNLDVIFVTSYGSVWIIHGTSGQPFPGFPVRLNTHTQSAPLLLHLTHSLSKGGHTLTAVVPGLTELILVDLKSRCVDTIEMENVMLNVLSGDIDPYNPGIEILAVGLDGQVMCFSSGYREMDLRQIALESWSQDAIGHSRFSHKTASLSVGLPGVNETSLSFHGSSFTLEVIIHDNSARRSRQITASVAIGRKHLLYNGTLPVYHKVTTHTLTIPTPPEPMAAFLTTTFCNEYLQCESSSHHARFNLHFRDTLQWYLFGPFLALSAAFLWLLRDANFEPLPGAVFSSSSRKSL